MNAKLHKRWTDWRRQEHLKALAEHGRLLAHHQQQTALCEDLHGHLGEYDRHALSGESMTLLEARSHRGFAAQIQQVHAQQQEQVSQLGRHLALARQKIQQRQNQLDKLEQMLQTHERERQRLLACQEQSQTQEWAAQRPPLARRH